MMSIRFDATRPTDSVRDGSHTPANIPANTPVGTPIRTSTTRSAASTADLTTAASVAGAAVAPATLTPLGRRRRAGAVLSSRHGDAYKGDEGALTLHLRTKVHCIDLSPSVHLSLSLSLCLAHSLCLSVSLSLCLSVSLSLTVDLRTKAHSSPRFFQTKLVEILQSIPLKVRRER